MGYRKGRWRNSESKIINLRDRQGQLYLRALFQTKGYMRVEWELWSRAWETRLQYVLTLWDHSHRCCAGVTSHTSGQQLAKMPAQPGWWSSIPGKISQEEEIFLLGEIILRMVNIGTFLLGAESQQWGKLCLTQIETSCFAFLNAAPPSTHKAVFTGPFSVHTHRLHFLCWAVSHHSSPFLKLSIKPSVIPVLQLAN